MKKEKLKYIAKFAVMFVFQIALSRVQFENVLPLGFSFALSRVFFGENLMIVAAEYAISNIFLMSDFYLILFVAYEIVILSLYYFFKEMFKIKRKRLFLCLFLILSTMPKVYFLVGNLDYLKFYLLETSLKIFAIFYFLKIREIYNKKIIFLKCSNFDYIMFSVFVIIALVGLFGYEFLRNYCGIFLLSATLILSCRILPIDKFLILMIVTLIAYYYVFESEKIVVFSMIASIFMIAFSKTYKYLFLSVMIVVCSLILIISGNFSWLNVVNITGSIFVSICVPQKIFSKFSSYFDERKMDIINENMWRCKEDYFEQKLNLMSKTLNGMRDEFKALMVGKIDRKIASKELAKDVILKVCGNCENFGFCQNSIVDKQEIIAEFVLFSIKNGSVKDENLSVSFKTYCNKTNLMTLEINNISQSYLAFEQNTKSEDESKLIVSTELENFSKLFANFAKNIKNNSILNRNLSFFAKEMLLNNMIEVNDIAIFEDKNGIDKIDIVASNELIMKKELKETVNKFSGIKMQILSVQHLDLSGLSLASFGVSNVLKSEFAFSSISKEMISGDNNLISKIDNNRFFVALADGMGHGKLANRVSKMVLELIKNLFLVGVDLEVIIESVNKLLVPAGLDNFSTLDAVVVDQKLAKCTFIKLGASVSAIKHKTQTELVAGESLPIGIVQNIKPTVITKNISEGDIVFLASDGVVDFFADMQCFKIFINDAKISNLQKFADNVIAEINYQTRQHKDDMSLIAIKLLKNS